MLFAAAQQTSTAKLPAFFQKILKTVRALRVKLLVTVSMLCHVMRNLFIVDSLQFPNDSTIASLKANQDRPKVKIYVNK